MKNLKSSIIIIVSILILIIFAFVGVFIAKEKTKRALIVSGNKFSKSNSYLEIIDNENTNTIEIANSYINKVDNIIAKNNEEQNIYTSYESLYSINKNLYSDIENTSNKNISTMVKNQKAIWNNYSNTTTKDLREDKEYLVFNKTKMLLNEIRFNIYNYLYTNGINPQFNDVYINDALNNSLNIDSTKKNTCFYQNAVGEIDIIQARGNAIINNALNNNTSLLVAYQNIYNLWSAYLNTLNLKIKTEIPYNSLLIKENENSINFQNEMVNSTAIGYKNKTTNNLIKIRMKIRLTEEEIINIIEGYLQDEKTLK